MIMKNKKAKLKCLVNIVNQSIPSKKIIISFLYQKKKNLEQIKEKNKTFNVKPETFRYQRETCRKLL